MKPSPDLPNKNATRAVFDRQAERYDQHAALEREVGSRLMERLVFQRRKPVRIVDLGSGTGLSCADLKRRFRKADVIGVDASFNMSRALRRRSGYFHPLHAVCADMSHLPFAERSVDLLFSNLALQWLGDFRPPGAEFRRVLQPGGLLLFSSLGPDSLKELRTAAGFSSDPSGARQFPDMHDIGDALQAAGFSEPVVDSEYITVEYREFEALLAELEATGAGLHFRDWADLTKPGNRLEDAYRAFHRNGHYPVTWEIVYGTAFGPEEGQPIKTPRGDVAAFSVDVLRRSIPRR